MSYTATPPQVGALASHAASSHTLPLLPYTLQTLNPKPNTQSCVCIFKPCLNVICRQCHSQGPTCRRQGRVPVIRCFNFCPSYITDPNLRYGWGAGGGGGWGVGGGEEGGVWGLSPGTAWGGCTSRLSRAISGFLQSTGGEGGEG